MFEFDDRRNLRRDDWRPNVRRRRDQSAEGTFFALEMMDFVLEMMNFVLEMMDFVPEMMDFVFK